MKQLFFSLALITSLSASAQTKGTAKLYGYKQSVAPGVHQQTIDEGTGKEINEKAKTMFNYFIYITSTSRVYPSEIWINGERFSAKVEMTNKTPVVLINDNLPMNPKKTVLVPKTSRKVIQLTPMPAVEEKTSAKAKSLAASNELVVVYKMNGKFCYQSLKKLTQLSAIALQ